jgi:hypothetical protein
MKEQLRYDCLEYPCEGLRGFVTESVGARKVSTVIAMHVVRY